MKTTKSQEFETNLNESLFIIGYLIANHRLIFKINSCVDYVIIFFPKSYLNKLCPPLFLGLRLIN
jgi:hypothetical protein